MNTEIFFFISSTEDLFETAVPTTSSTVRIGFFELGNCLKGANKKAVKSGYAFEWNFWIFNKTYYN